MKPIIFIILDGLGDRPIKELNWQTPLEAAQTPNLDAMAQFGITGLIHTIERGIRPGSDVAHLSILGYDPRHYYSGRGPFEASGYGIQLQSGDIAFRGNLATTNDKFIVVDRRAGRIESSEPFAKLLNGIEIDQVKVIAKAGLNHRIAVVLRGPGLSDQITDVDPHLVNKPVLRCQPKNDSSQAKFTAAIVNKLIDHAHKLFKEHPLNKKRVKNKQPPANYLLVRGAGKLMNFKSFFEVYGLKSACIAGAGLYKGIARILGMEITDVSGANGKPDSNIVGKIKKAIELTKTYDFIFVHIKATDSLAEDGKFAEKMHFIEKIDDAIAPLLPFVKNRRLIVSVTGDHTTASDLRIHTADEVPILVAGFGVRTDHVEKFGERPCQRGGLGHIQGRNLIDFLINLRGESHLYGN